MDTVSENMTSKVGAKYTVSSSRSSIQKDDMKNCCGICLEAYKSPRILLCKHVFCRLCLEKLANEHPDSTDSTGVLFGCPVCREEIKLPKDGVNKLRMFFEDDDVRNRDEDDEDHYEDSRNKNEDDDDDPASENEDPDDNEDGDDNGDEDVDASDNEGQGDLCVVCENNFPAEYECFQCQKVFCDPCKKSHDIWLTHEVRILNLKPQQDICKKHPGMEVRYFCQDCIGTFCKECVQSDHSLHQTQTLSSYLMEINGELEDYSTKIRNKLEKAQMLEAMFSSKTDTNVLTNIENIKKLGEDFKKELEMACRGEKENQLKDKTLLNRINLMGKRIKKIERQRIMNQNLISEIEELRAKVKTHQLFYLASHIDDIIAHQIGAMDIQMGRMFEFQLKNDGDSKFHFIYGMINWTLSVNLSKASSNSPAQTEGTFGTGTFGTTTFGTATFGTATFAAYKQSTQVLSGNTCVSAPRNSNREVNIYLTPFRRAEDVRCIEAITTDVTCYVEGGGENGTVSKRFSNNFRSENDQMSWKFKQFYIENGNYFVKVLFQRTIMQCRIQVD